MSAKQHERRCVIEQGIGIDQRFDAFEGGEVANVEQISRFGQQVEIAMELRHSAEQHHRARNLG